MRGKPRIGGAARMVLRIIPAHAGQTGRDRHSQRRQPDHPRACGANAIPTIPTTRTRGSSPRMRGKQEYTHPYGISGRIIPAHAGQTRRSRWRCCRCPDHPRACGANFAGNEAGWARAGSSPRMRGKHLAAVGDAVAVRIIPAHAGQTAYRSQGPSRPSDHPRACGANEARLASESHAFGSSPRMRGKPAARSRRVMRVRIIPAHAGQTSAAARAGWSRPDHPRACGANVLTLHLHHAASGSSPRMRGKRLDFKGFELKSRIIPAHAGQTTTTGACDAATKDHPRACGANAARLAPRRFPSGSSPRMRGKRRRPTLFHDSIRIIPAHAGQTIVPRHPRTMCPDHPRACGANLESNASSCCATGSSPRMRGKRRR